MAGSRPIAVSPDSITASVPSNTALATSLTSARVGDGASIIDSSIWVAVTTGVPTSTQCRTMCFWRCGTSSSGQSMPRSPRATITASAVAAISARSLSADAVSILAMILERVADHAAELGDVVRVAHERQRDVVDARRGDRVGEHQVVGGRRAQREALARQVHARAALGPRARLDLGLHPLGRAGDDTHRDRAVAEHDAVAGRQVGEQVGVVDVDHVLGARPVAGDQRHRRARARTRRHPRGTPRRGSSDRAGRRSIAT